MLPIELVEIILRLSTEEDPFAPRRTRQADLAHVALASFALRQLATPLLLQRPAFSTERALEAFRQRVLTEPTSFVPQVVEIVLRPRGPVPAFEEAWATLLRSTRWPRLQTMAFMYAYGIQRRLLRLDALSSHVGSTLTTLVLCHLDLEMPSSAFYIRPFPHVTTLVVRHSSILKRHPPLPSDSNILPLGTLLSTPKLRTLHIHAGKSRGAISLDDFTAFAGRLVFLSLNTSERPLPRSLEHFSALTSFEVWLPPLATALPLRALSRANEIRELRVRDELLERGGSDDADSWSDAGSDLDDFTAAEARPTGQAERFVEVLGWLIGELEAQPPLLPVLKTLVLSRAFERAGNEERSSTLWMERLRQGMGRRGVELRFEERYWASESAGQEFVLPTDKT